MATRNIEQVLIGQHRSVLKGTVLQLLLFIRPHRDVFEDTVLLIKQIPVMYYATYDCIEGHGAAILGNCPWFVRLHRPLFNDMVIHRR